MSITVWLILDFQVKMKQSMNSTQTLIANRYLSRVKSLSKQLACAISQSELQAKRYQIVILVEIGSPWHTAKELIEQLTSTFQLEFVKQPTLSTVGRFEKALKAVNSTISRYSEKIEDEIDCAIAVVTGTEVTFAAIGKAALILRRNGRYSEVSSPNSSTEFTAVTSGDIQPEEVLFITGRGLRELIVNFEELGEILPSELSSRVISTLPVEELPNLQLVTISYSQEPPQTYYWEGAESRLPFHLPKIKFSLPKIHINQLTRRAKTEPQQLPVAESSEFVAAIHPFKSKLRLIWRPIQIVLALGILIGIVFGINSIRDSFNRPDTPEARSNTLLEDLRLLDQQQLVASLQQIETVKRYIDSSEEDKIAINDILLKNQLIVPKLSIYRQTNLVPSVVSSDSTYGLFFMDKTNSYWSVTDSLVKKIELLKPLGTVTSIAAFKDKQVLSDSNGSLWLFNGSVDQPLELKNDKLPAGAKLVSSYSNNLYILAPNGSVFRQREFSENLDGLTAYVKAQSLINSPIQFVTNGDFLVRNTDNQLISISKGTATNISLLPKAAALTADSLAIYGLNNNFLQVAINGQLQQYYLPIENPVQLTANNTKSIFVWSETAVYLVTL